MEEATLAGYRAHCERRWAEAKTAPFIDALMAHNLRRYLAVRYPRGTRRRLDAAGPVKRYDMAGRLISER